MAPTVAVACRETILRKGTSTQSSRVNNASNAIHGPHTMAEELDGVKGRTTPTTSRDSQAEQCVTDCEARAAEVMPTRRQTRGDEHEPLLAPIDAARVTAP